MLNGFFFIFGFWGFIGSVNRFFLVVFFVFVFFIVEDDWGRLFLRMVFNEVILVFVEFMVMLCFVRFVLFEVVVREE